MPGALLISSTKHDVFMERFPLTTVFDQPSCEVIEQFWVRIRTTATTKITRGLDNPTAKVMLPKSISQDTIGKRIVGRSDPLGKSEPPSGRLCVIRSFLNRPIFPGKNCRNCGWDNGPGIVYISTPKKVGRLRVRGGVNECHDPFFWIFQFTFFNSVA